MLAGFLLLLLLTDGSTFNLADPLDDDLTQTDGGSSSDVIEPPDDQQMYIPSSIEDGSTFSLADLLDDELTTDDSGSSSDVTEPPDDQQMYIQSSIEDLGLFLEEPGVELFINEEPDFFDSWMVRYDKDMSHCTHADIIKSLSLTDKVKYSYTRPAKNYSKPTEVKLDVHLYAILDVRDKEQAIVTYIWINTIWHNPLISWKSEDFCGIPFVYFPNDQLWKPDIMIEEMTEKDKATQTSYLAITNNGSMYLRNGMVLVSTCRMQFYKFPFDIQICNLTFKSISMSARDLQLLSNTQFEDLVSKEEQQYEWLIVKVNISREEVKNYGIKSSVLVYTITMKRRSVLYIVNFILPIMFFFCVDLASFLVLDSGGEKLGFKVTVLLAVTVMQLILNDILPSSSNRIPLIATFCIGVFSLMLISLMETILVMYLTQKDRGKEADEDQSLNEGCKHRRGCFQDCFRDHSKSAHCSYVFDEKPPALLLMQKEGGGRLQTEEPSDLEKLSDEVRELMNILSNRKQEVTPGYWAKVAKKINTLYVILYIITSSLFLGIMFSRWVDEEDYS